MAATRAATPASAAATWSWLAAVGSTSGGSFGAMPTTTVATPAMPISRRAGRRAAMGPRRAPAIATIRTPSATMAARTTVAPGWPGEASRLTVS
jgi:hypothetical protein